MVCGGIGTFLNDQANIRYERNFRLTDEAANESQSPLESLQPPTGFITEKPSPTSSTSTPLLTNSTLRPETSTTPTATPILLPEQECGTPFEPPCFYVVQGSEGNVYGIAVRIVENPDDAFDYARLLKNLNRDNEGYLDITVGTLRVPPINAIVNLFYMQVYFPDYTICKRPVEAYPCLYKVSRLTVESGELETYRTIAIYFYNFGSAEFCIRDANKIFLNDDLFTFSEPELKSGVILVLPVLGDRCQ